MGKRTLFWRTPLIAFRLYKSQVSNPCVVVLPLRSLPCSADVFINFLPKPCHMFWREAPRYIRAYNGYCVFLARVCVYCHRGKLTSVVDCFRRTHPIRVMWESASRPSSINVRSHSAVFLYNGPQNSATDLAPYATSYSYLHI